MKGTKPSWYHNTAYTMEPYFVCLHFPNLLTSYFLITSSCIPLSLQWEAVEEDGWEYGCVSLQIYRFQSFSFLFLLQFSLFLCSKYV